MDETIAIVKELEDIYFDLNRIYMHVENFFSTCLIWIDCSPGLCIQNSLCQEAHPSLLDCRSLMFLDQVLYVSFRPDYFHVLIRFHVYVVKVVFVLVALEQEKPRFPRPNPQE